MQRSGRRALSVCLLLAFAAVVVQCSVSEADIRKMKIKPLREFLLDRGVECVGCEEKEEFVRLALQHKDSPIVRGSKKSIPSGTLWEVWSQIGKQICFDVADAKGLSADAAVRDEVCHAIANAVESVFMQYGKRTANKLKKKPDALLRTSFGDVYHDAGRRILKKVAGYCFHAKNEGKCRSIGAVEAMLEKDGQIKGVELIKYLTNVGIENTNTMYEVLKDKTLMNDEL